MEKLIQSNKPLFRNIILDSKASLVFEKDSQKYCLTNKGNDEVKCKDGGKLTHSGVSDLVKRELRIPNSI